MIKKLFFGKKSCQRFFRKLFDISIEGMNIGTGGGNICHTGEAFVISHSLKGINNPIVFDVGAQGGDYIREVFSATGKNDRSSIFAFEPSSKDFVALKEEFGDSVKLYKIALSDSNGKAKLFHNGASGLSSLYNDDAVGTSEKVPTETIDSLCKRLSIGRIDLLKLDVEGNELVCLRGAQKMLPYIKNIQFEMSIRSRDARVYFKDIFEYLHDYRIYRILKDNLLEIKSPDRLSEMLFTTNYLAIRK